MEIGRSLEGYVWWPAFLFEHVYPLKLLHESTATPKLFAGNAATLSNSHPVQAIFIAYPFGPLPPTSLSDKERLEWTAAAPHLVASNLLLHVDREELTPLTSKQRGYDLYLRCIWHGLCLEHKHVTVWPKRSFGNHRDAFHLRLSRRFKIKKLRYMARVVT